LKLCIKQQPMPFMNSRYSRQELFSAIGKEGQARLSGSRVLILGCGALGSTQAEMLARAGVGYIKVVDRDFVDLSNLQRQSMYTEQDVIDHLPKAIACVRRISEINSEIKSEALVLDVNSSNIESIIEGVDLVIDGTDNFSTRYLLNEACVKHGINWIYGAAVGSYGLTMTIRPEKSPCLRCVFETVPAPGSGPTCDTSGVIMPIISTVAGLQIAEAFKLLTNDHQSLHNSIIHIDLWKNSFRTILLNRPLADCSVCVNKEFENLKVTSEDLTTLLCGRNACQITPTLPKRIDLNELAQRLSSAGRVKSNGYLVRLDIGEYELTIFSDGRAIIGGTDQVAVARSLYSKYIGN
jgi:molybdopterin-synthase adenylyltransferase